MQANEPDFSQIPGSEAQAAGLQTPAAPPIPQVPNPGIQPLKAPGPVTPAEVATDPATGIASAAHQNQREVHAANEITRGAQEVADGKVQLAKAEQEAFAPVYQHAQAEAVAHQDRIKSFTDRANSDMQTYMGQFEATQNELHELIRKQPKDMWEASGVSKIPGIIGVVLGAIGSKNGQNVALARIDALAQRNVEKQKAKAEMLSKLGAHQTSLFYLARAKLGSDDAAEAALYNAALEDVKKQADAIANQFKTPQAQQAANELTQALSQQQAEKTAASGQTALQSFYKNYLLEYQQERFSMKAQGGAGDPMRGIIGFNPQNKVAANDAYKDNSAAQAACTMIDDLIQKMESGGLSVSDFREDMATRGPLTGRIRKALGLGARLEGSEEQYMNAMMPTRTDILMSQAGLGGAAGVVEKLKAARRAIAKDAASAILSADANAQLDPNDPVYGPLLQEQSAQSHKDAARDVLRSGKVK